MLGILLLVPLGASASEDEAIAAVQVLREGGCGGLVSAARPLHRDAALDRAAALWANGVAPAVAARNNGYAANTLAELHVTGADASLVALLRRNSCQMLTERGLQDLGVYHRGVQTWLILGSRSAQPPAAPAARASLAARTIELVNDIRARGTRCGNRSFAPAPPVKLSDTLNEVALGHAADMAEHDYFEHEDRSGHTPAERVRAAGYREQVVGENIAYGPESADEVVKGWLDSPGHCENIMDPRFAEMGIAYSPGKASRRGLYWVQLLAAPKA
jgi:uncharacterized protein YkwD